MIHDEEPAVFEEDDVFEDVEADFAEPGPAGTYVLSTRRPGVVSGPSWHGRTTQAHAGCVSLAPRPE